VIISLVVIVSSLGTSLVTIGAPIGDPILLLGPGATVAGRSKGSEAPKITVSLLVRIAPFSCALLLRATTSGGTSEARGACEEVPLRTSSGL